MFPEFDTPHGIAAAAGSDRSLAVVFDSSRN
jgi:hypothetical protein